MSRHDYASNAVMLIETSYHIMSLQHHTHRLETRNVIDPCNDEQPCCNKSSDLFALYHIITHLILMICCAIIPTPFQVRNEHTEFDFDIYPECY